MPNSSAHDVRDRPDFLMNSANMRRFSHGEPSPVKAKFAPRENVLPQGIARETSQAQKLPMKLDISSALKSSGMTQSALADAVGIKKGFMSEIISGKKSPSLETLIGIATVLNVSIGDLFTTPAELRSPHKEAKAGLNESQTAPFTWHDRDKLTAQGLVARSADGLRHAETYQLSVDVPWLSLCARDILVVDIGTPPSDGNTILVGITDSDGFSTRTALRRFYGGYAISGDASENDPVVELESSPTASWRGTVRAIVRLLGGI